MAPLPSPCHVKLSCLQHVTACLCVLAAIWLPGLWCPSASCSICSQLLELAVPVQTQPEPSLVTPDCTPGPASISAYQPYEPEPACIQPFCTCLHCNSNGLRCPKTNLYIMHRWMFWPVCWWLGTSRGRLECISSVRRSRKLAVWIWMGSGLGSTTPAGSLLASNAFCSAHTMQPASVA